MKKVLFLFFLGFCLLHANDDISIQLSASKQNAEKGIISVTFTNKSNEDIEILKWGTPFEKELSRDIFSVKNSRGIVEYLGREVKRVGLPTARDYISFKAGEKHTIDINLPHYYDIQTKGVYDTTYTGGFRIKSKNNYTYHRQNLPKISFFYAIVTKDGIRSVKKFKNFNTCKESQIILLKEAHEKSIILARNALDAIDMVSQKERYKRWFGVSNSEKSVVKLNFNAIYSALNTKNIAFNCECFYDTKEYIPDPDAYSQGAVAYVKSAFPYTIYICDPFFKQDTAGFDTQAGTLIHEVSHFTKVAHTHDFVYGMVDAKSLAKYSSTMAIATADNNQYFSEDYEPGYYVITTTIKRKEKSKKERQGNSMLAGSRNLITTNVVETTSKQLMYVDIVKGRVILLPLKERDSSIANLQSYKLDRKACKYDLVTDTQVDKHIRHKQASVLNHNIKLSSDDYKKSRIIFQIRDAGLKENITVSWKELENTAYILKKDTYTKETQQFSGISFGRDYNLKQDRAASLVLNNLPLGKKDKCQVRGVHDMFIGEGASQFDLSFEYEVEIAQARINDIKIFKVSNVSDHWEYRAIKIVYGPANGILESLSGVSKMQYTDKQERYADMKEHYEDLANTSTDTDPLENEPENMSLDDLKMFTD